MNGLLRLLMAMIVSVLGWLSLGAPAAVAASPSTHVVYTYDGHHQPAALMYEITERGPPGTLILATTYEAVGDVPFGPLARPDTTTTCATYGYDDITRFAQTARSCSGAEEQVGVVGLDSALVHRSDVAAKTETSLARTCLRSFSGTTLVLMADGTKKPIQDVRVGDKVVATDPETGERVTRKVTHVWVHDDTLTDLRLADGTTLTTTEDHHFWSVTDHTFEQADQLSPGEVVLGDNGRQLTIVGFEAGTDHTALAYNLSVEGVHTYHVGDDEVLVHNTCGINPEPYERQLENGITRSYGKFRPARTEGPTAGARYVRETGGPGGPRGWMESYYENGSVRQVHPKGGDYPHYLFDELGNYMGFW